MIILFLGIPCLTSSIEEIHRTARFTTVLDGTPGGISLQRVGEPFELAPSASGSNFYWVGAESYDSSALSNMGIQGTIEVVKANVTGCLSFWVADEMASNNVWGQVGYSICNGSTIYAFYEIWNGTGVAAQGYSPVSAGNHQFSMYDQSGTAWAYALDGVVFGTFNMGSSASSSTYPIEALSEEGYVSAPWNPPKVEISAIKVLKSGSLYSPQNGFEPYGCGTTGMSCWGVAGNLQNSTIPTDAIVTGGNTPLVSAGAWLWQPGTADFTMGASPMSITANAGVAAKSTITVAPVNGFTSTVSLSDTTNSTDLSCTISPASVAGGSGSSNITCASSVAGNYMATVRGTSGALSHYVSVSYHVRDFILTGNPTTVQGGLSSPASSVMTVVALNGFAGTVIIGATTNSSNLSCTVSPSNIAGGSGASTLSCTSTVSGNYLATVTGTNGTLSHSVSIVYQITNLPGFTLENNPSTLIVDAGVAGESTITISSLNGFSGTVTLTVMTNSTSLSCTLSPSTISGGSGTSTLSCIGSSGSNYVASVTGSSSGITTQTTWITYHAQDFAMSAGPSSVNLGSGATGSSTINFVPINGFTGSVTLTSSVSPTSGLVCTLSTAGIFLGPSRAVTLSCTGTAGSYNVTVTAIGGAVSHHSTISYLTTSPSNATLISSIYEIAIGVAALILALVVARRKRQQRNVRTAE